MLKESGNQISKHLSIDSLIDEKYWILTCIRLVIKNLTKMNGKSMVTGPYNQSDVTDKHGKLYEDLAAKCVIYNINELEPQMLLNNVKKVGIISSYTDETFENMLNK